jgi:tripartite ATP-independent transporter DctP family solute receptor
VKIENVMENMDQASFLSSRKWFWGIGIAGTFLVLAIIWALWGGWITLLAAAVLGAGGLCYWGLRFMAGMTRQSDGRTQVIGRMVPELVTTSQTLAELADRIAAGSQGQAVGTSQVAASMEELSASIEEVATHTQQVSNEAEQAFETAHTGSERAREAVAAIQRMAKAVDKAAGAVESLDKVQLQIGQVVGVIEEVANETNLLALNATIEAARVGKYGAGFAVVAGEVRNLAQRTAAATTEISKMIEQLMQQINDAGGVLRTISGDVESGVQLVEYAGESFTQIEQRVSEVRGRIGQIAEAADQQAHATMDVTQAMEQVAAASTTSSSEAMRVSQASQSIWVLADEIKSGLAATHQHRVRRRGRGTILPLVTMLETTHPIAQTLIRIAGEIEQASKGRLKGEIVAGKQTGLGDRDILRGLRSGEFALGIATSAVLANYAPALNALDLPYAFRNADEAFRVLDGPLGTSLLDPLRQLGMIPYGYLHYGARHFTNNKQAIHRPEDLRGLVIRVVESSLFKALCHALGAKPKAVPYNELVEAVRTGAVEVQENPLPTIYQLGIHRYHRYLTLDGHTQGAMAILGSEQVINNLSPEMREILDNAIRQSIPWQRELAQKAEAEALAAIQAHGVRVTQLSQDERDAFVEKMHPVWEQFRGVIGDSVMTQIQRQAGHRIKGAHVPRRVSHR